MIHKALVIALLLIASAPSEAQPSGADAGTIERGIYASIADKVRAEFEHQMAMLRRVATARPPQANAKSEDIIKFISYNKAAIYVYCVIEFGGRSRSRRRSHRPV